MEAEVEAVLPGGEERILRRVAACILREAAAIDVREIGILLGLRHAGKVEPRIRGPRRHGYEVVGGEAVSVEVRSSRRSCRAGRCGPVAERRRRDVLLVEAEFAADGGHRRGDGSRSPTGPPRSRSG